MATGSDDSEFAEFNSSKVRKEFKERQEKLKRKEISSRKFRRMMVFDSPTPRFAREFPSRSVKSFFFNSLSCTLFPVWRVFLKVEGFTQFHIYVRRFFVLGLYIVAL